MRSSPTAAALVAILISVYLQVSLTRGLQLVSSQPTGSDSQNNPSVHYVPKMATKLGLPPPQNREPETPANDALATAIRQLLETHRRQKIYLERLAALTPSVKTEDASKKKTPKQTTTLSQPPNNSESSNIMHPPKQKVSPPENKSSESTKKAESELTTNSTVGNASVLTQPMHPNRAGYPTHRPTLFHRQNPANPHHYVPYPYPYPYPYSPSPLPIPPSAKLPYHKLPIGSYHQIPEPYQPRFLDKDPRAPRHRNLPLNQAVSTYPHERKSADSSATNVVSPVFNDYKSQYSVNSHSSNINPSYSYQKRTQG